MTDNAARTYRSPVECVDTVIERTRHEFETLDGIIVIGTDWCNLRGNELIDFVRRCILALVDAGAKPFTSGVGMWPPTFHPTEQWGTTREAIADRLIAEWQMQGGGELEWGSYPFAFVERYYPDGWPEPARGPYSDSSS